MDVNARAKYCVLNCKVLELTDCYYHGFVLFCLTGLSMSWLRAFLPTGSVYQWCTTGIGVRVYFFLLYVDTVILVYPGWVRYKLFADDLKIYSNIDSSCASINPHNAMRELKHWCHMCQLQVNLSKTSVVHLGANNPRVSYSFNNTIIVSAESIRDLGDIIDSGHTFDAHVNNVVSKAYTRIAMLFREFSTRNTTLLRHAYITHVHPILEYASSV